MWGRRRPAASTDETTAGLRQTVLGLTPGDIDAAVGTEPDRVYGVLMEMGYPTSCVTIVSLLDGTTSMYLSSGGGTIGAGQHDVVARASTAFVAIAQDLVDRTEPTREFPVPEVDRTRFQLLTVGGGRTAEAGTVELGRGTHPLAPLFHAGQGVVTQIRLLQQGEG